MPPFAGLSNGLSLTKHGRLRHKTYLKKILTKEISAGVRFVVFMYFFEEDFTETFPFTEVVSNLLTLCKVLCWKIGLIRYQSAILGEQKPALNYIKDRSSRI